MAVLYVGLTVLYFVFALAALSMPSGTGVREYVVGFAYLCLGAVLGSMLTILPRLVDIRIEAKNS